MCRSSAAILLLVVLASSAFAQGKLQQARDATYASSGNSSSSGDAGGSDNDDGVNSLIGELLAPVAYVVLAGPFVVPQKMLETMPRDTNFSDHPYAASPGYLKPLQARGEDEVKSWGFRVGVEEGNDFSGLNRLGLRVHLDTDSRFGISSNWDWYQERLSCGCTDSFVLGDLMATYRFVQAENVQMHAGLGGRGLFDQYRTRGGFNFLYSADIFPVKPFILSAQAEIGHLNQALTTRLRGQVGVQFRRGEAFIGYDWFRIGGADLHGPMAGLRLWF